MTSINGGIATSKYGVSIKSPGFSTAASSVFGGRMDGKIASQLKKVKNPEKIVEPYANKAVMASSFPAPFPNSPIAGVTRPRIINGMENDRKFPNKELNVTNIRTILAGKN